jgi:hypothetical protein
MKTTIDMAREADFVENAGNVYGNHVTLKAFAELVRADERDAMCDIVDYKLDSNGHAKAIKLTIRARKNQK